MESTVIPLLGLFMTIGRNRNTTPISSTTVCATTTDVQGHMAGRASAKGSTTKKLRFALLEQPRESPQRQGQHHGTNPNLRGRLIVDVFPQQD